MTVEAMSALPLQAGGAVAAAAGRTLVWAVSSYMRAPLRNTALAALIGLSAMAGANALYKQAHHHPSPLFGSFAAEDPVKPAVTKKPAKKAAPVVPAARPKTLSSETTGSIDASGGTSKVIDTAEVTSLQQQLKALQLFDGNVDGLFGPKTAKAIKAFEAKVGRTPRGLLTPQIIALVKATPIPEPTAGPTIAPAPTAEQATQVALNVEPAPAVTATVKTETPALALAETEKPLPAPSPLLAKPEADVQVATAEPAEDAMPAAELAQQTLALAAQPDNEDQPTETASLPTTVTKRTVQTIPVRVQATPTEPAEQEMPAALDATADAPPALDSDTLASDSKTIAAVQRGLNSLGFLHGEINGVADEATAKAIRNFEVYFNFDVTGRITKELVRVLVQNGAVI